MIDSRKIEDLHPILQVLASELIKRMTAKGYSVLITSTYRDIERQNALYAQGRTKPGSKVTDVSGGKSAHNHRLAFDICKNIKGQEYNDAAFFNAAGVIGKEIGLEWGGDFKSLYDPGHFQLMFGYSCSSYLAGTKIPKTVKSGCLDKRIVKFIQKLLGIDADGIYGAKTKEAVIKYNPSGEVDAPTLSKLIASVSGTSPEILAERPITDTFPRILKKDMRGDDVKALQMLLTNKGYSLGTADGIFGAKTDTAVKAFQKNNNLIVDGIVGAKTVAALTQVEQLPMSALTAQAIEPFKATAAEQEILYRIVQAEAGGEDEIGKILVANVILNRVRAKGFPNNIKDVVFQPQQFEPTRNGTYDKAILSAATIAAVSKALSGIDYSQKATFFRAVKTVTPDCWHETALKKLFDHGGHRFYK